MHTTDTALLANISILAEMLETAAAQALEAREAMERGERNLAIGTLDVAAEAMETVGPLWAATQALHRRR